jgi:hypothetical protein
MEQIQASFPGVSPLAAALLVAALVNALGNGDGVVTAGSLAAAITTTDNSVAFSSAILDVETRQLTFNNVQVRWPYITIVSSF